MLGRIFREIFFFWGGGAYVLGAPKGSVIIRISQIWAQCVTANHNENSLVTYFLKMVGQVKRVEKRDVSEFSSFCSIELKMFFTHTEI